MENDGFYCYYFRLPLYFKCAVPCGMPNLNNGCDVKGQCVTMYHII